MASSVTIPALVEAGFAALAEHGLAGLTMRDVAQRLGVKAPAIYWHLKSRSDLVDEMATEMWRSIYQAVQAKSDGLDPVESLTVFAHELRTQALARRDGARLLVGTYLTDDELLRAQQQQLAGIDATEQARRVTAYTLVYSFVIGYVVEEQARRQAPERYGAERRAARLGTDDVALSALVLDTGDDRFAELLEMMMVTVRRTLRTG